MRLALALTALAFLSTAHAEPPRVGPRTYHLDNGKIVKEESLPPDLQKDLIRAQIERERVWERQARFRAYQGCHYRYWWWWRG